MYLANSVLSAQQNPCQHVLM